jgi:hypothetical protein
MSGLKTSMLNMVKHLQDDDLRVLRGHTHEVFDKLWRENYMTRSEAYAWLRGELNLTKETAHIALLTREQCLTLMEKVWHYLNSVWHYLYGECDATEGDIY